jgi:ABC-type phosphate transport system substrate-binding protein
MRSKTIILIGIGIGIALLCTNVHAQDASDYVVIANQSADDSISKKNLSRIFRGQRAKWLNGTPAKPVDLKGNSPTRVGFSQQVLGRTVEEMDSYWQGQVFAGRKSAPPSKASDQEIVNYVRSTAGSVGYVAKGTNISGVKSLRIQS